MRQKPHHPRRIQAPRGSKRTCKNWQAEAALRMLHNNLDPEVAEDPDNLVVYGGRGQAVRSWEAFEAIVDNLRRLGNDETLLIQSGKPVGVLTTHNDAPRVLIANSNLVPHWATSSHFDELFKKGLIMFGQMTAGSWIYIGTQGILQGTFETFAECARQHFNNSLVGRLCVTGGCGGMGGAQPLSITMNGGTCLIAEVDKSRLERRIKTHYLDEIESSVDEAIDAACRYRMQGRAISIGVEANAVELLKRLIEREITPDILTDQTSAHDAMSYVPTGLSFQQACKLRRDHPEQYRTKSLDTILEHVKKMVELQRRGAVTFDYGNNIRQQAYERGFDLAFSFKGFVPAYIRPQFCRGRGPFRYVALSGDPEDIYTTDRAIMDLFPEDQSLQRWFKLAREKVHFQGLPARICWLGLGERDKAGLAFNDLVKNRLVKAPIVIGRDHLDCGSVASPTRETEAMADGSDAISDWPILNAMLNVASGASWVSFHHGGGVGIGYAQHAGQVIVADGTKKAAKRLKRVLTNDPAIGVLRHADAGYPSAILTASEQDLRLPMEK